jgi:hypothetical protein
MRRIVAMLAVLVISMVALVAPAFAAASDSANCVGQFVSDANAMGANLGNPGLGGQIVGSTAPGGVVGQYASSNDCPEE